MLFVDACREFIPGKNQNQLSEEHFEKIVTTVAERRHVDKYADVASLDEIAENDFNLNIPRYVDTFEEEEEIDVATVQREIDQLEQELTEVRARMRRHLQELGVEVA